MEQPTVDREALRALFRAQAPSPDAGEKFAAMDRTNRRRELAEIFRRQQTDFRGVGNLARGVGQSVVGDVPAAAIASGGMVAEEVADAAAGAGSIMAPAAMQRTPRARFDTRGETTGRPRIAASLAGGPASSERQAMLDAADAAPPPRLWDGETAPIAVAAAQIADRWRREVQQALPYERSTGTVAGFAEDALRSAPTTVAGVAIGVGTGVVTRNPGAGLAASSIFMALSDASSLMEETYREQVGKVGEAEAVKQANRVGAIYAPASALLERVGLGKILTIGKNIPGKNRLWQAAKRIGEASATEFMTEAAQTAAGETVRAVVTDDWQGVKELAESDELFRAGLTGALLGGGVRTGVEAINPANYRTGKAFLADVDGAKAEADAAVNARAAAQLSEGLPGSGVVVGPGAGVGGVNGGAGVGQVPQAQGVATPENDGTQNQAAQNQGNPSPIAPFLQPDNQQGQQGQEGGADADFDQGFVQNEARNQAAQQEADSANQVVGGGDFVRVQGSPPIPPVAAGRFSRANGLAGVRQVEPETPAQRAAVSFFAERNVPVYLVTSPDGSPLPAPAMWTGDGVVIDANAGTPEYTRALVYHEAFHDLKQRNPTVWKKTYDAVRELDPDGLASAEARYFGGREAAGVGADRDAIAEDEALASYAEAVSAWLEVARRDPAKMRRVAERNPRTMARMLDAIQRAMRSVGLFDRPTILERQEGGQRAARIAIEMAAALDTLIGQAAPTRAETGAPAATDPTIRQSRTVAPESAATQPAAAAPPAGVSSPSPVSPAGPPRRSNVRPRRKREFSNADIRRRLIDLAGGGGRSEQEANEVFVDDGVQGDMEFDTSFSGPVPSEIRIALEGQPPNIRTLFRGNVARGGGEDIMAAIGPEEMVARVRRLVEGRDARADRVMEMEDPSVLGAEAGMLATIRDLRGVHRADEIPEFEVVENPDTLPDGSRFEIMGTPFVVVREGDSARAVAEDASREFNLSQVDAMPVDRRSLDRFAKAPAPVAADTLDDIPFAIRPEPRGPGGRDLLGRPVFEPATGRQQELPIGGESEIARQDRERRERQARENGDDPEQRTLFAVRPDPKAVSLLDSLPEPPAPSRSLRKFFQRNGTAGMFNGIDPNPQSGFEAMLFSFRRTMQDKFLPILRVQQAVVRAGGRVSDAANAYRTETLYYGRSAEASRQFNKRIVEPLFRKMTEAGVERGELDLYLYAKHAPERNRVIREKNPDFTGDGSGMSDADAAAIVARFEAGPKGRAFKDLEAEVAKVREWSLDYMVKNDLLSEAQAAAWRATYQNYVPLRTADPGNTPMRVGQGFQARGPESKEAKGRGSLADSPLLFLIHQADNAIVRAERNRVALSLRQLVLDNPDRNLWNVYARDVKRTSEPDMWGNTETEVIRNPTRPDFSEQNTIVAKLKGEDQYIVIENADIVRAMKNMGTMQLSRAVRAIQVPMRILSGVVTTWSPEFILTNFVRDVQTAGINVAAEYDMETLRRAVGPRNIRRAMAGAWEATRAERRESDAVESEWAKTFREFTEDGGKTGWAGAYSFEDRAKEISQIAKAAKDEKAGIRQALIGVKNLIEDANQAVENAVRVSLYAELRRQGMPRSRAAEAGKNLTVNFNRKGEAGTAMNTAYMFYNAGIQGSVRTLQAVNTRRGRKIALGIAGFGLGLNFLNASLSDEDEDGELFYDKISPWVRSHNFIVMLPGTGGRYIKIPMPYGYNVFHALGTHTASALRGEQTGGQAAGHIGASLLNSFNPIGGGFSFTDLVPTLAQPAAEIAVNQDFAGRPINPERFPGDTRPYSEVYFQRSSLPAQEVAGFFNRLTGGNEVEPGAVDISPGTIDHWLSFFTGSAGKFVVDARQTPVRVISGEGVDASSTVFSRRFVGAPAEWRHESSFWRNKGEMDTLVSFDRRYLQSGDLSRAEAFRARQGVELDAAREFQVYAKVIDDLRERMAEGDDRVTEEEIRGLLVESNRMVRAAKRGEEFETPLLDSVFGVFKIRQDQKRRLRDLERDAGE